MIDILLSIEPIREFSSITWFLLARSFIFGSSLFLFPIRFDIESLIWRLISCIQIHFMWINHFMLLLNIKCIFLLYEVLFTPALLILLLIISDHIFRVGVSDKLIIATSSSSQWTSTQYWIYINHYYCEYVHVPGPCI